MKVYIEPKATDSMLQLDIIKKHILPKKFSQRYEIKFLHSNKYDEQLNLTRSSIKNKLFETNKEFKEIKFQRNEVFRNKIFADS